MAKQTHKTGGGSRLTVAQLKELALGRGAMTAKVIKPAEVVTAEWVRWKCRYGCGCYGSSLVCPPYTPTPSQMRAMLDEYKRAILFEASPGVHVKKTASSLERELFLAGCYKAFGLGAGSCELCDECAFDEGCRHPRKSRPAMEACGIDVFATVRKHGFTVEVVKSQCEPIHIFGLVLVD